MLATVGLFSTANTPKMVSLEDTVTPFVDPLSSSASSGFFSQTNFGCHISPDETYTNNPYRNLTPEQEFPLTKPDLKRWDVGAQRLQQNCDSEELIQKIDGFFADSDFSNIEPDYLEKLRQYFHWIALLTPARYTVKHGLGWCSESASVGVLDIISHQLKYNQLGETIQLLELYHQEAAKSHALTLTGAKPFIFSQPSLSWSEWFYRSWNSISSTAYAIPAETNLIDLWKKWFNEQPKANVCDKWLGYQGSARKFINKLFAHPEYKDSAEGWQYIKVYDFTVPDFYGHGIMPRQREFFKGLLRKLARVENLRELLPTRQQCRMGLR